MYALSKPPQTKGVPQGPVLILLKGGDSVATLQVFAIFRSLQRGIVGIAGSKFGTMFSVVQSIQFYLNQLPPARYFVKFTLDNIFLSIFLTAAKTNYIYVATRDLDSSQKRESPSYFWASKSVVDHWGSYSASMNNIVNIGSRFRLNHLGPFSS